MIQIHFHPNSHICSLVLVLPSELHIPFDTSYLSPITEFPDDSHFMDEIEKLLIVIKKLKQDYQEVLMFKYVEELSVSEIAEILERSQISVRVTLHRAMKKLKEMIAAD